MTETNANENETLDPVITQPHGKEQQMKMAKRLEAASGEPGYAGYVKDQLRAVYGCALQEEKLLTDELDDVTARLHRIEAAYESDEFTEEEHTRIGFAITRHKKNIERLKELIQKAKADHKTLKFRKN